MNNPQSPGLRNLARCLAFFSVNILPVCLP